MKKNSLTVALNMSSLSVPEKIKKARLIVESITANAAVFVSPNPPLATITTAIDELDAAYDDTADGAKSKTAIMYDKVDALMKQLGILANYVEQMANDDSELVHLAAMDVKRKGVKNIPEFDIQQLADLGAISLRVKARKKTMYKWQYAKEPLAGNEWVNGPITATSKTIITDLESGIYWFRVVFIDGTGEHESSAVKFAVN